jgi:hypothetical protein
VSVAPVFVPIVPGAMTPPFTVHRNIDEQSLFQFDLGVGYWLYRNPEGHRLTGLAPTIELHYTTTLDNADLITPPQEGSAVVTPATLLVPRRRRSATATIAWTFST